ncbi:hypothetical protein SERLADRAFT_380936 [Serpula lacrymans var. lacrymans S7.9]|uniref:Uncharacterized protein n=1 Tax=Serpula lacrymans var. lacrymans (strain S7.9) TaxID=578457 RepID=F8NKT9_SERL9|nr:uncharacterized protein SERLADRAFT_380936 [Serpula lacrymans var. lacrymans S7.9]EGO28808.1 hypothetical protein SERLADRAFT_380936 [Serpula lacrymans var. lacrymans S7.9]
MVFKTHIEDQPPTIGNPGSLTYRDPNKLRPMEQNACRCVQLVADLVLIMEQVFLYTIVDKLPLEELCKAYLRSAAYAFVQREVVAIDWRACRDESDKTRMMTWRTYRPLKTILDRCRKECPIDVGMLAL